MDGGKSNLINQAFKIFREVYSGFLRELFHQKFGPHWLAKVQPFLKTSREKKKHPNSYFDIPNILSLILGNWNGFFENYITRQERGYLFEVRNMRNRWAHQENISSDDLLRTFDNILRLLRLHYFNNQEIETTHENLEEFDESKIAHVRKLKDYVFLKVAESIESKYGVEKRRIVPPPNIKLQQIIFGNKKDSNSRNNGPRNMPGNNPRNNFVRNAPPQFRNPNPQQQQQPHFNNFRPQNIPPNINPNNFNPNFGRGQGNGFNNNFNNSSNMNQFQGGNSFQRQRQEEDDVSMMDRNNRYY